WRTSPEQAVCQRLAPPFHLAASQSRPEPGRLYRATGRRLPPISSTCYSFEFSHRPPRRRSLANRSAELTWSWEMLCPMVTRLRQLRLRIFHQWTFLETVAEMLRHPRTDACHWSIMQIVEHSLAASHDGFANSCLNVWQCGPADTYQIA